jgi:hypothetical protein
VSRKNLQEGKVCEQKELVSKEGWNEKKKWPNFK